MNHTDADQRADTAFLVGVAYGRNSERALLADRVCDAYVAAQQGQYDQLTALEHLAILVEQVGGTP